MLCKSLVGTPNFQGIFETSKLSFISTFPICRTVPSQDCYLKVNFKIHDVTTWLTNNCYTHITQYLKK